MNQPNKLECYTTLGLRGFPFKKYSSLMGLFLSCEENEVLWIWPQGPYLQHYIYFVAYKLAQ
jgi:hypothetical protein